MALVGRPNVGKSTLVNNLIGQKVAITSPLPQTTRFPIYGVYKDERGTIIFIDTPGIFNRAKDALSKKINKAARQAVTDSVDLVLYVVDPTRRRDFEESKVIGIVRSVKKPTIVVFNKADVSPAPYMPHYMFLQDEYRDIIHVSALQAKHLKLLINRIFELLPEQKKMEEKEEENRPHPTLNIDSRIFIAELIREKVFLKIRKEVPYSTTVVVDDISERPDGTTYIKARILTTDDRYKTILIGKGGRRIREIGMMSRKELEVATGKKVYLDLMVETDRHWVRAFS